MSMRKIKRRHYRLLARARSYEWFIDSIFVIMREGARKTHAALVKCYADATGPVLIEQAVGVVHELATAGQAMYFTEAGDPGSYEVDIRLPPWYTQKGALE